MLVLFTHCCAVIPSHIALEPKLLMYIFFVILGNIIYPVTASQQATSGHAYEIDTTWGGSFRSNNSTAIS